MSASGKLNLIWFRDEQPARRLRLRPAWIRVASYLLVLVTLCAAGGAYASYQLWRRAQQMQNERRENEKRLSETLLKLERLQNIEKLLQTTDQGELSQLLAGLGVETQAARSQAASKSAKDSKDSKDPKDTAKNGGVDREKPAGFDLADILGKVDLSQVGVENFRAKVDAKTVSYAFDLSNLMPQALSGNGQLLAVTRSGGVLPVSTGKDDLGFSIQRFKQVSSQAPLPPGVEPGNLFGFRMVITNASGKTIFSETYPFAQTP
jgi:hypothetical protein